MYNQFYFLHIDKTIARTAEIRMFYQLYKVIEDFGVSAVNLNTPHKNHNQWKDFDEKTFIFSIIRDPVSRTISDFCWWANYGENNIRTHFESRDWNCPFYNKKILTDWIETKHIPNYQSSIISNNISRINMLVKAEYIINNENKLRENILNKMGISYSFPYYAPDSEHVFMPHTKSLDDMLINNPSILEKIKNLNKKDLLLYNQASNIF